jgi:hypothetical protein
MQMCSNNNKFAKRLEGKRDASVRIYPFNISNPMEYINGATAKMEEVGPYIMNVRSTLFEADFSKPNGTVSNHEWSQSGPSSTGASFDDEVFILNYAYMTFLKESQHEGLMLMRAACSSTQIGLIANPAAIPYCTTAQMRTAANCKCCALTPTANATSCSGITSAASAAGGLFSWLSKYDNGIKVSSSLSAFPFATGTYSSLIRKLSVREITWGSMSAFIGMMQIANAMASYPSAQSSAVIAVVQNKTQDLKDACYTYSSICPKISTVMANVALHGMSAIAAVDCNGRVPAYTVLMENGMPESRAHQLRYLEGVSCRPFAPAVAIGAALSLQASTKMCADGSTNMPCCLLTFSATGLAGSGVGCVFYVDGALIKKRSFSEEEYALSNNPVSQVYTACADKEDRFEVKSYQGLETYKQWFTPATYVYPNMPWADPVVVKTGLANPAAGTMLTNHVRGNNLALREPVGVNSDYLDANPTDGEPDSKYDEVFVPYRRGPVGVAWQKTYTRSSGLEVNRFVSSTPLESETDVHEARQRQGQVPYQNMQSMIYILNAAIVQSYPMFYGSEESSLMQSDNLARGSNSTSGVKLFRTRNGYSDSASVLPASEEVTSSTWGDYGESEYRSHVDVEPATGVSVEVKMVNQINTFTWNCNPSIDPSCKFLAKPYDSSNPLCYNNPTQGVMFACSNANVFTPKVFGGKLFPVIWTMVSPPIDTEDGLNDAFHQRYVFAILALVIPLICVVGIIITWAITLLKVPKYAQVNP